MSALADELILFYQNTIISQYCNKTKAVETIGALMGGSGELGIIADAIYNQVRDGFDLDNAVGVQLDTLGRFRGVSRFFATLDLSKVFVQMLSYDDPGLGTAIGIADYDDPVQPPSTYTLTYDDFILNTLQDDDFRRVIKFLAQVHSSDFAYASLDTILFNFFADNVNLIVTGNMDITYEHLTSDQDNLFEIVNQMGLLPTPAGVSFSVSEVASF